MGISMSDGLINFFILNAIILTKLGIDPKWGYLNMSLVLQIIIYSS